MTTQNVTVRYDGGVAFPGINYDGMSLRDWFAGMALQGILAGALASGIDEPNLEFMSKEAYQMADAMIIQRQQCQKP